MNDLGRDDFVRERRIRVLRAMDRNGGSWRKTADELGIKMTTIGSDLARLHRWNKTDTLEDLLTVARRAGLLEDNPPLVTKTATP